MLEFKRTPLASRVPFSDLTAMTREQTAELDLAWRRGTETSAWIGGEPVARFEEQWARYCGVDHAIGVANGTDALELTFRALGIGPGDEVLVPANTFIATAEAVVLAGATPVFVDVDPETLLVSPETIRPALGRRTAAIVVVPLYGHMPPMDDIGRLAGSKQIALIEDAAQAHGSTWKGRKAGTFGLAGCFSFYPGKNLGAFGDAGAVVTDDAALARRIRSLANHGRMHDSKYLHGMIGRNSRLDALQASILSVRLPKLDEWNRERRRAVHVYAKTLEADLVSMVRVLEDAESVYHQNVVRVRDRDWVQAALLSRGIQTGIHYPVPCHQQGPYMRFAADSLPVAERAADEILSLPLFPHITEDQVEYVSACLNEIVEGTREHVG
jgi:dTDP-4-amino-4,6-dideoxygalactose transaminase